MNTWIRRIAQAAFKVAAEMMHAPSGNDAKGTPASERDRLRQPKGRVHPPKDAA